MAINTSNNKVRIISTTVGLADSSKYTEINSPALVVNTSDGGIFYADGTAKNPFKQLAALPNHTHSGYATQSWVGANYLSKSGGTITTDSIAGFNIYRNNGVYSTVHFYNTQNDTMTDVGYLGASADGKPVYINSGGSVYDLIHSNNISTQSVASATNATTATKTGNNSILIYPENSNEINFGGTSTNKDIYFGYRGKDSRDIPRQFIFGGSTGTANIKAAKFIGDVSGNVSGSAGSVAWSNVTGKPEIYTKSSVGTLDWPTTSNGKLINVDAVAYWNGAYQNTSSNLAYCDRGRFGTIVTKNAGDYATTSSLASYLPISGGTMTGSTQVNSSTFPAFILNHTGSQSESGIRFEMNGANKGYVGYHNSYGTYIWNSTAAKYLCIADDGEAYVRSTTAANKVIHSGNIGQQSVASANALGSYTIDNFMTFGNYTNYVGARFQNSGLAQLATDTYIEFWSSPGWYNSAWGKVTAHGGFTGDLTGTASNANALNGYTHANFPKVFTINSSYTNANDIPIPYDNQNSFQEWHLPGVSYNGIIQWRDWIGNCGQLMHVYGNDNLYYRGSAGNKKFREIAFVDTLSAYCLSLDGGQMTNGARIYPATNSLYIGRSDNAGWVYMADVCSQSGVDYWNILSTGVARFASTITAANFITDSDRRLKTNINEISSDKLSNSLNLNFVEFDYKNNDNHSAGHIAQEVKEVLPEFVHGNESETEHLSIDYTGLHSIQIKALIDENNTMKKEIKELKELIKTLINEK